MRKKDVIGKAQFSYNVVVYWFAQILVIASGFIVPRQISDNLGIEILGVWDIGWATYNYLAITGFFAIAVNRYIALYRSTGEQDRQSQVFSTSTIIQFCVCLILLLLSLFSLELSKEYLENTFKSDEITNILRLFCFAVIVRLLGDSSRGVITGEHRWDLHHVINAIQDILLAIALVFALQIGATILTLGYLVLISSIATTFTRIIVRRIISPDTVFSFRFWDKKLARELFLFGAKTFTNSGSQLILFQTAAILLGAVTGPSALAIYTRSQTLIRISEGLIQKIANMFVPITSSLIGLNRDREARELLLDSCILFMSISIPISLGMIFFGDLVIEVWMGAEYAKREIIVILALGSLFPIAHTGVFSVLAGMNAHGKLGIISLSITLLALLASIPILNSYYAVSYLSVSILVAVTWGLSRGFCLPIFLLHQFQISIKKYLICVVVKPSVFYAPMAIFFYFARQQFKDGSYLSSLALCALAGIITATLIWKFLLPPNIKKLLQPTKAAT